MNIRASSVPVIAVAVVAAVWGADAAVTTPAPAPVATVAATVPLPATLQFDDSLGRVHLAELPADVVVAAPAPTTVLEAGDVAYWASQHSLAIVQDDVAELPAGELSLVGSVTSGMGGLAGCDSACVVEIEGGR